MSRLVTACQTERSLRYRAVRQGRRSRRRLTRRKMRRQVAAPMKEIPSSSEAATLALLLLVTSPHFPFPIAVGMALSFSCSASLTPQQQLQAQLKISSRNDKCLQKVKDQVKTVGIPSIATSPSVSLKRGNWVKLICGASFEDVVDVRNLSLVYTLAGVDCIDCAADASVVSAVNEGIEAAREIVPLRRPWVMISVNDDEDLHFRKAEFDPNDCPLDCSRPCEIVCPANAISLEGAAGILQGGVITERCYGCGRCLPVCPFDKIRATTYIRDVSATAELLRRDDVDAIEIHTSGRQTAPFKELWTGLGDSMGYVKIVAISLPYIGDSTISVMNMMYSIMLPNLRCFNLWQLDGRPMSGDIGRGATREAISFAVRLASDKDRPHGFLQLAGGTNAHTVDGLKREGLFQVATASEETIPVSSSSSPDALIGGVAYGGYARKIVGRILSSMQSEIGFALIEDHPEYLLMALTEAVALVGTVKCYDGNLYASLGAS